MRAAVLRVLIGFLLVLCTIAGQIPESKTTLKQEESKADTERATAPTAEEAAKSAAPAGMAAPVDPSTYRIGAPDILQIRVWGEERLSGPVQVRPDGKIALPLIGELQASDLTPEQLKNSLIKALDEFMNKPEVFVSVLSVLSKKFQIGGEINRPGTYPLVVPIPVLEALTNAGGFKDFAKTKKITILRKGQLIKFNYNDVVRGKNMEQNILVENGDYIHVP